MPGPKATRETRVRLDFGVNPDKREKSESQDPMDPPERFDKSFLSKGPIMALVIISYLKCSDLV